MRNDSLLTGRKTTEVLLFGIMCLGLLMAGGGIIISSAPLAFAGAALAVFALWCFYRRAASAG